ncbi:MAG: Hsp33 family molecular chaperone HslO [Proteobacteria bacterium]|nr:Hsp33 family molecular chaperone HslO [Pseudomonadota bacterium]HQR03299.1 Hsp33 family molecular chaperone HslO [Rhodocyclaceae bacterium]
MMDAIHRFIFEKLAIRGTLVQFGPAWRSMQAGRDYPAVARDLLGQMATVTALIGSNLKTPGRISFQIRGNGAINLLVVDCDESLRLRGMVKTQAAPPADATLTDLLGDAQLVLTLQTHGTPQPYQSIVPMEGNTVATMLSHYLSQSEQQPTALWLAVDEAHACGLFLQRLPEHPVRDEDGWNRVTRLAETVRDIELALPPETLLGHLFAEEDVRLFKPRTLCYHCPRDEAKVRDMLRSLGRDEIASIVAEHGSVVIQDDICNHEYRFGPGIVDELFPPAPRTLH